MFMWVCESLSWFIEKEIGIDVSVYRAINFLFSILFSVWLLIVLFSFLFHVVLFILYMSGNGDICCVVIDYFYDLCLYRVLKSGRHIYGSSRSSVDWISLDLLFIWCGFCFIAGDGNLFPGIIYIKLFTILYHSWCWNNTVNFLLHHWHWYST